MRLHKCPEERTSFYIEGECSWCGAKEGEEEMFNPFKLYDEMLGIYLGAEDEDVPMVTLEYTVPEELADELEKVILGWLSAKGIELDEDEEDAG